MDIGLPDIDGYETGKHLRTLCGGGQSLLLADRKRSEEAGFDVDLIKPVDPERLEQLIPQKT